MGIALCGFEWYRLFVDIFVRLPAVGINSNVTNAVFRNVVNSGSNT